MLFVRGATERNTERAKAPEKCATVVLESWRKWAWREERKGRKKTNSPDPTPHCRNNTFLPSPTALFSLAGRKKTPPQPLSISLTRELRPALGSNKPLFAQKVGAGWGGRSRCGRPELLWPTLVAARRRSHGRLSHAAGTLFFGATTTVLQPRKQPPSPAPIPHLLLRPPCSPLPPPTLPRTHTQTYITPRSLHATASEEARSLANRADLKIPESTKKQLRMLLFFFSCPSESV